MAEYVVQHHEAVWFVGPLFAALTGEDITACCRHAFVVAWLNAVENSNTLHAGQLPVEFIPCMCRVTAVGASVLAVLLACWTCCLKSSGTLALILAGVAFKEGLCYGKVWLKYR